MKEQKISKDWVKDLHDMHAYYDIHEALAKLDKEKLKKNIEFRLDFIQEELDETRKALNESDAEEIVDGLIDICVVAIGTLDQYGIDSHKAWDEILKANMNKKVGIKPSRPNPLGLPDLIKPEDWVAPSHEGNHGLLTSIFEEKE